MHFHQHFLSLLIFSRCLLPRHPFTRPPIPLFLFIPAYLWDLFIVFSVVYCGLIFVPKDHEVHIFLPVMDNGTREKSMVWSFVSVHSVVELEQIILCRPTTVAWESCSPEPALGHLHMVFRNLRRRKQITGRKKPISRAHKLPASSRCTRFCCISWWGMRRSIKILLLRIFKRVEL